MPEAADTTYREALSVLGHELRRPLTVIRGAASLLAESGERLPPERSQQMLDLIVLHSGLMADLVDDLLTVSRLDAGDLALVVEDVPAAEILAAAVDVIRPRAGERTLDVSPANPALAVRADRQQAITALRALIDNAVQHAPGGAPIELGVLAAADGVRFEVRDRGPGVPAARAEEAFGRFHVLEPGSSGAGLGLYLARGLARLMGGDAGLEARPGGGCVSWITLTRGG